MANPGLRAFLNGHMEITQIAAIINIPRKTVYRYLSADYEYETEMTRRKEEAKAKRKEYQLNWDRENRSGGAFDAGLDMRQRHELDAIILSREGYFHD